MNIRKILGSLLETFFIVFIAFWFIVLLESPRPNGILLIGDIIFFGLEYPTSDVILFLFLWLIVFISVEGIGWIKRRFGLGR